MIDEKRRARLYRVGIVAWLLAICCTLLCPAPVSAHAILLRSTPAIGAVLRSAPTHVRLWFSEDLNPTFTTSYVVDVSKMEVGSLDDKATHVDLGDAHVATNDTKEVDLSLKPDLPPAVYLVFYRTQSTIDGHILEDSFFFTIARPDGTVPTFNGSLPVPPSTEDFSSTDTGATLDGATLWTAFMTTLIDIGVVFWVGAQLWAVFVFALTETGDQQLRTLYQQTTRRFEVLFSIPILWTLFLSNVGILIGQALVITNNGALPLTPALLIGQVVHGQFGLFWMMREVVILLALLVAAIMLVRKKLPRASIILFPWLNLVLGLALLAAVTLSGHAAAVDSSLLVPSILLDGLHLLAASLWVGGMFYLSIVFLPILKGKTFQLQTQVLLETLAHYSPLAIVGVLIMAMSGSSNAGIRLPSWLQLFTTAYGNTLLVKIALVGGLCVTSAVHVFWLRPHLKKTYQRYVSNVVAKETETAEATTQRMQQVQVLEKRMQQQTYGLMRILRWEPLLGLAVLICTGLLGVFSGTLQPVVPQQEMGASGQPVQTATGLSQVKIQTTDAVFAATLTVSPNHQGFNGFTVQIPNQQGMQRTAIGVVISMTIPGMDMGTTVVKLQGDGKGKFSGGGIFSMPGRWLLRIEFQGQDKSIHQAQVRLVVH
jgi:copper transport protein